MTLKAFINGSVSRGKIDPNWYMTSVQAGFEPWIGGASLAVNLVNVNGDASGSGDVSVIRGAASNRCVDVAGWGKNDGTPVHLWDCFPNNNQRWRRVGNTFVSLDSGKCLDAIEFGTANGTRLQIWDCGNPLGGNQQWRLG